MSYVNSFCNVANFIPRVMWKNTEDPHTFCARVVVTFVTWHIVPRVPMSHAQCVNTILIFEVVRLIWRPEGEVFQLLTGVHKGSLNTSVIQPNPGLLPVVPMLDVHILFLIVNCGQVCARIFALIFSGQPTSACGTCEVAIAIKETPARLTNVLKERRKKY